MIRIMPAALLTLLMLTVAAGPRLSGHAHAEGRFPPVTAENLEGRRYQLPKDFAGQYTLLAVAWKRAQQRDVDSWMPFLSRLEAADKRLYWYELPVISKLIGTFMGPIIDRGMRSGIPSIEKRRRVITIYIDKDYFRRALALPDSDRDIHVLLIDKEGRVRFRVDGPFSRQKAKALRDAVRRLPQSGG